MTIGLGPRGTGVLRMVRPGVLLLWCPACEVGHTVDIHAVNQYGKVLGWDGDFLNPTIGQPIRNEAAGAVCEYVVQAGVIYYLSSSTHSLAGQQRHMVEFPLDHAAGAP